MKKKVLFICTHNSARSQMAEGLLRSLYGDQYEAYSAGTEPSDINPYAIRAMAEIGIDISMQHSKSIEEFRGTEFDYVVTVCDHAKEVCPFFPNAEKYLHKNFKDLSSLEDSERKRMEFFRSIRNEIKEYIKSVFDKENETNQKKRK